jgi:hypothetical protein
MNVEVPVFVLLGIFAVFSIGFSLYKYLKWLEGDRRANELLRSVLTCEQYSQLMLNGHLDIPSPHDPECVYRVPRGHGLVKVIERGRLKGSLCLQPLEWLPVDDRMVMHKLMIEADEETYLQTAKKFAPVSTGA